ncbi:MAG TPA: response regulator [Symbiobacteriaceae bacterium]|nr:response regulator [Symbiobacteriaceae bacterium]
MAYKLMIAEDEELELMALRRFVERLEDVCVVAEARNGLEAVQLAQEFLPDLALVDIRMPGISGLDALRQIRRFHPDMRALIITAYGEFSFAHEALSLGASDYLLKPAHPDQVLQAVRKVLDQIDADRRRTQAPPPAYEPAPPIQGQLELEKQLAACVRWGDEQGALTTATRLLDAYWATPKPGLDAIRIRLAETAVLLSRAAAEGDCSPERSIAMTGPLVQELQGCKTEADLRGWLLAAISTLTSRPGERPRTVTAKMVARVAAHLQTHYAEAVSMEDMARFLYLNPSYFSRVFKQETGRTFVEYLTEVRMDMARNYLATTDEPVGEVARLVGYRDRNYFSRLFTQITGRSPTEFRTMVGGSRNPPA